MPNIWICKQTWWSEKYREVIAEDFFSLQLLCVFGLELSQAGSEMRDFKSVSYLIENA